MILLVDKPAGMTSRQVVTAVKRAWNKKVKIGHTGTLDPMCTGLLPVLTGNDTKFTDYFPKRKSYRAVIRFGVCTDTGDVTGKEISRSPLPDDETAKKLISDAVRFTSQIPPMYSAVHCDGKRLYELAREGKTVNREPRPVQIFSVSGIEKLSQSDYAFTVDCSTGTYVRTLCEDIAASAGLCATMAQLRRISSNGFTLENSHSLEEVIAYAQRGELSLLSVSAEASFASLPASTVPDDGRIYFLNGGRLSRERLCPPCDPGLFRAYDSASRFLGLGECDDAGFAGCAVGVLSAEEKEKESCQL